MSDQIGSPTYATDLAEAILKVINNKSDSEKQWPTEVYHYSSEGEVSWYDFARKVFKVAKIDCKVKPITTEQYPTSARRPRSTLMDKRKIIRQFGVNVYDWKVAISACMTALLSRE